MQKDSGLGSSGQVLTGLALVIDGRNTFGETGEVKMPDWEFLVVNEESTGIVKSPKVTVPLHNLRAGDIAHIEAGNAFLIRGNLREGGIDKKITITIKMQMHKMGTTLKEGEFADREFEGRVDYWDEQVAGAQAVKYMRQPAWLSFGGGDNKFATFNANVGVGN